MGMLATVKMPPTIIAVVYRKDLFLVPPSMERLPPNAPPTSSGGPIASIVHPQALKVLYRFHSAVCLYKSSYAARSQLGRLKQLSVVTDSLSHCFVLNICECEAKRVHTISNIQNTYFIVGYILYNFNVSLKVVCQTFRITHMYSACPQKVFIRFEKYSF